MRPSTSGPRAVTPRRLTSLYGARTLADYKCSLTPQTAQFSGNCSRHLANILFANILFANCSPLLANCSPHLANCSCNCSPHLANCSATLLRQLFSASRQLFCASRQWTIEKSSCSLEGAKVSTKQHSQAFKLLYYTLCINHCVLLKKSISFSLSLASSPIWHSQTSAPSSSHAVIAVHELPGPGTGTASARVCAMELDVPPPELFDTCNLPDGAAVIDLTGSITETPEPAPPRPPDDLAAGDSPSTESAPAVEP